MMNKWFISTVVLAVLIFVVVAFAGFSSVSAGNQFSRTNEVDCLVETDAPGCDPCGVAGNACTGHPNEARWCCTDEDGKAHEYYCVGQKLGYVGQCPNSKKCGATGGSGFGSCVDRGNTIRS